jgi:hypothetical protein
MSDPRAYDEERLGRLIGLLEPAPEGWAKAAQEIPAFRRMLDGLVARSEADQAFRDALLADLEAAFAEAGFEPRPRALAEMRRRVGGLEQDGEKG